MENGTYYYYILNLQGDVIRLIDGNGMTVALYEYDPYGKILSATGSMASINPLRYRGYYYDNETQLYYCLSRYYDPQTGRFISADSFASTGQGILGHNMFAYCGNNPVNRTDEAGDAWVVAFAVGFVVGAIASVATEAFFAAVNNEEFTFNDAVSAAVGGAVTGSLQAIGVPPILASTAGTAVSTITSGLLNGDDGKTIAQETVIESSKTLVTGVALSAGSKMLKNSVGGKYLDQGPVGEAIAKLIYEPRFLNEHAPKTIIADTFWDSVDTIILGLIKRVI